MKNEIVSEIICYGICSQYATYYPAAERILCCPGQIEHIVLASYDMALRVAPLHSRILRLDVVNS